MNFSLEFAILLTVIAALITDWVLLRRKNRKLEDRVGFLVEVVAYMVQDKEQHFPGNHRFVNGVCACGNKPTDDPEMCSYWSDAIHNRN